MTIDGQWYVVWCNVCHTTLGSKREWYKMIRLFHDIKIWALLCWWIALFTIFCSPREVMVLDNVCTWLPHKKHIPCWESYIYILVSVSTWLAHKRANTILAILYIRNWLHGSNFIHACQYNIRLIKDNVNRLVWSFIIPFIG